MKKHILVCELVQLCERNRDGSFSTQAARKTILLQADKDLLICWRLGSGTLV